YLPESVTWRQKEQFSDGVGYTWIDTLREMTSQLVTDEQREKVNDTFPVNPPMNKEEYYYRTIFTDFFPYEAASKCVRSVHSVACRTPIALEWDAAFKNLNDPSGRSVSSVHEQGDK
ncbi:MAG: asparagine synthase-related protein, partial [Paludibacter sp.]|nr:asparagine synthase-related protein [Paludibacter sp.]